MNVLEHALGSTGGFYAILVCSESAVPGESAETFRVRTPPRRWTPRDRPVFRHGRPSC